MMVKKIVLAAVACLVLSSASSQSETKTGYTDFPIVISLQFHSFALPFKDLKSNFRNIGIGLGTELSLNGKQSWVQQVSAVWYTNKMLGNGILIYTQNAWRPTIGSDVYGELKAGVGYLYSFRPTESFKQKDGEWTSVGRNGKGLLTIPVGAGFGYNTHASQTYISPFVSYQFLVVSGYNKSIQIVPETLFQAGCRIH